MSMTKFRSLLLFFIIFSIATLQAWIFKEVIE